MDFAGSRGMWIVQERYREWVTIITAVLRARLNLLAP
jgi:hypothetical protein